MAAGLKQDWTGKCKDVSGRNGFNFQSSFVSILFDKKKKKYTVLLHV